MKPSHQAKSAKRKPPAETKPVTRDMVHARTRELALQAGRVPSQVTQIDYEQARRDVTGESEMARQEAVLEAGQKVIPPPPPLSAPSEPGADGAMYGFSPETRALCRPPEKKPS